MSWLSDSTELLAGGWLSSAYSGHGILGANIPEVGFSGGSPAINDGLVDTNEYRWRIVTPPSAGTLVAYEDLSFEFYGAPDGDYTAVYELFENGVSAGTATLYLYVGPNSASIALTPSPPAFSISAHGGTAVPTASISFTAQPPAFGIAAYSFSSPHAAFSFTPGAPDVSLVAYSPGHAAISVSPDSPVFSISASSPVEAARAAIAFTSEACDIQLSASGLIGSPVCFLSFTAAACEVALSCYSYPRDDYHEGDPRYTVSRSKRNYSVRRGR